MKNPQQIINFIKEMDAEVSNINNIPNITLRDKPYLVQARIETSKALQRIIEFAEAEESSEGKDKYHELVPSTWPRKKT